MTDAAHTQSPPSHRLYALAVDLRTRITRLVDARPKAPEPPFEGWGFLWRPALLGFLALVAIAVGTSFSNSPFKLEMAGSWFFGVPTQNVSVFATPRSTTLLLGITLVYGGLVLLARVWIRLAGVCLRHPGAPVGRLGCMLALWILPMLVIAPIFSRDVYSYAAQGEMVTRHLSPYVDGPAVLGGTQYADFVDKLWRYVPAPYGPLFLSIDGGIVQATGHNVLWTIVGLRLLEVLAVAILAVALPSLARSLGHDAGHAFVLCLLNPLVVLTLVGGAHNDGMMVALLVAGLALAARRHPVWGLVLCATAASFKAPAMLGCAYIGWQWLGPKLPVRMRLRPLAIAGLMTLGVLGLFTVVSGLGFGWIRNLETPGVVVSWLSPATGLGMGAAGILHVFGVGVATSSAIAVSRAIGLLVAGALTVVLLFNADRLGWLRALGLSLLALVLLGPVVQPWYLTWGLLLLAPVAVGRLRTVVLSLSVISPFVGLPGGRLLLRGIVHAPMIETALVLFMLWALLGAPLGRWTAHGRRQLEGLLTASSLPETLPEAA